MKVKSCLYCGENKLVHVTHRSDNNGIARCTRCGVMMVENISDDTESLYTKEYFEKGEDTKSGYTNYLSSPAANLMGKYGFSRLFARSPGVHLDLGCADGSLIEIFKSAGYDSSGLEISRDAVDIATDKGLSVQFSRLHTFPEKLKKSNLITAFDLLEHADKPGAVLREVYKNLQKDGYFVFSTLSVKRTDPTDYWFNNSLEHYVYYDEPSLRYILTEIFGADNFAFVDIEINGVSEFWGFAKKGTPTNEKKIISNIATGGFDKNDAEAGYLVSLFYDQLSKFDESARIIKYFAKEWTPAINAQAKFYNAYFQGKFELALKDAAEQAAVGANNSVYWQALSYVQKQYSEMRQKDIANEYNREIIDLREQVFRLRDELHGLRNSRVLGKIIKVREKSGEIIHGQGGLKRAPIVIAKKSIHRARVKVAPLVPEQTRTKVKSVYRKGKAAVKSRTQKVEVVVEQVANNKFDNKHHLLSIVIPYYNRADTIDETIASLHRQTYTDFEVVIVDDGSTNQKSVEKLDALDLQGLDARIVKQKNQGVAAARNNGIRQTNGKYVVCLDSDDILAPTFLEKAVLVLETQPDVSLITTHMDIFGVIREVHRNAEYDPLEIYSNNMVITAAVFRRTAWSAIGGYTPKIGYEDWEYWIKLAENGFWGKLIPEQLFVYRTSLQSRYVEDKDVHWNNIKNVRALHPEFKKNVKRLLAARRNHKRVVAPETSMVNLASDSQYSLLDSGKPNVLITMPWMTFGGAETLVYNYCREVKDNVNLSFITGLRSENEWQYKFEKITPNIYHLPNLFEDSRLYIEFIANYIRTRNITILHIVHNGFVFEMLPELKKQFPALRVIVTLFNDRVPEYVAGAHKYAEYIDDFVTDNEKVAKSMESLKKSGVQFSVIPNGIDAYDEFSPLLFDRESKRTELDLRPGDHGVFFVGRLSKEKNPHVFVRAAKIIAKADPTVKFFMVGDGPMRHDIEKLIKESQITHMKLLGYQPDVAPLLSAADVFVLPSSIEGFPLSILEAMAMEVAVVASDVGAVGEVIDSGTNGYVVKPGDAQEVASHVVEVIKDEKKLTKIQHSARKKVEEKYSNRILGANYRKLYNKR